MARIRSIHPGIFTDERYMAISIPARELLKGLWCEADDQGAFEWKPLTIKARIFPADAVSIDELLAELAAHNFIRPFEVDGGKYGALRNFRKFQRPKKPTAVHPLPDELRQYVQVPPVAEYRATDGGVVPHQFGTSGEESPQMEDEGGRGRGEEEAGSRSEPFPETTNPSNTAQAPSSRYAFGGKLIRLSARDFDNWRKIYHGIPDLVAELHTLDAYYHAELVGDDRKRWFIRCSSALDKKHQEAMRSRAPREEGPGKTWTIGIG